MKSFYCKGNTPHDTSDTLVTSNVAFSNLIGQFRLFTGLYKLGLVLLSYSMRDFPNVSALLYFIIITFYILY